jgi:hypothetical protein
MMIMMAPKRTEKTPIPVKVRLKKKQRASFCGCVFPTDFQMFPLLLLGLFTKRKKKKKQRKIEKGRLG